MLIFSRFYRPVNSHCEFVRDAEVLCWNIAQDGDGLRAVFTIAANMAKRSAVVARLARRTCLHYNLAALELNFFPTKSNEAPFEILRPEGKYV